MTEISIIVIEWRRRSRRQRKEQGIKGAVLHEKGIVLKGGRTGGWRTRQRRERRRRTTSGAIIKGKSNDVHKCPSGVNGDICETDSSR